MGSTLKFMGAAFFAYLSIAGIEREQSKIDSLTQSNLIKEYSINPKTNPEIAYSNAKNKTSEEYPLSHRILPNMLYLGFALVSANKLKNGVKILIENNRSDVEFEEKMRQYRNEESERLRIAAKYRY